MVRDLLKTDLPFLDLPWITGAFTPDLDKRSPEMRAALSVSDELIAELRSADDILMGVRETGGLLKGKSVKIILASGRVYTDGSPDAGLAFASGYLKAILGYMGMTDVEIVFAGGAMGIPRGLVRMEDHIAKYEGVVRAAVRGQ